MQRPFLHLKHVLRNRDAWHSIVINLATAPDIFMEARCLLHKWFLLIGADRILEVRIELLAAVLDVHSNPGAWGISVDDGLKLPTSYAFFCQRKQPLLMNLMKPLSCGNLVEIVDTLEDMQSLETFHPNIYSRPDALQNTHGSLTGISSSYQKSSEISLVVNHNSSWSLLLDFPLWFHFASMLLFRSEDTYSLDAGVGAVCHDCEQLHSNNIIENFDKVGSCKSDSYHKAAKYLGWVLCPIDARYRDLVVRSLLEASKRWNLRSNLLMFSQRKKIGQFNSDHNNLNFTNGNKRTKSLASLENENYIRVKKAKLETVEKNMQNMDIFHCLEESAQAVMLWLADFSALCSKCLSPAVFYLENTKSCSYRVAVRGEDYGESEDGTVGKDNSSCQNAPSDAWLKKYAFMRRISMGLFLSNVHVLDEQACHMLLHFAAADDDLTLIPDSDACTHNEMEKTPWATAHVVTSSNVRNIGTDTDTKKSTHQTESSRNAMLVYFQSKGRTNWTRVASIILSFLDIIETSYSVFQNINGCPSFWSDAREKGVKFLATCIQQLLECGDFLDPGLLIDLRSRFVKWTQQDEVKLFEDTLYHDIVCMLDSQISLLHTNL